MKWFLATVFCLAASPAFATIIILKCDFSNLPALFFTIYDDGTSVRVGTGPGVGNRALLFRDPRNKTIVVIEQNTDGVPYTFTTIAGDLTAVHSRASIGLDGSIVAPSQGVGQCRQVPLG